MGELAPLGTGANRVLRARVSFSLKVESLRDEHPEVRKRLGSFESEERRETRVYYTASLIRPIAAGDL